MIKHIKNIFTFALCLQEIAAVPAKEIFHNLNSGRVLQEYGKFASNNSLHNSNYTLYVFGGNHDGTIELYNSRDKSDIGILRGHTALVCSLPLSPDGVYLASGSRDNTARLWDLKSKKTIALFHHNDLAWGVKFDPDGTQLITSTLDDDSVRAWDIAAAKFVYKYFDIDGESIQFKKNFSLQELALLHAIHHHKGPNDTIHDAIQKIMAQGHISRWALGSLVDL